MRRHAYLITAYDDFYLLGRLLETLDDPRNDIYLHVDRRSPDVPFDRLRSKVKQSDLVVVERIPVYHGEYSQVDSEFALMEAALKKAEDYSYLHLISGSDLPIKSQDFIHEFFRTHDGNEFLDFSEITPKKEEWVRYLYPLGRLRRSESKLQRVSYRLLRRLALAVQRGLRFDRRRAFDGEIKTGSDWYSVTPSLARLAVSQRDNLRRMFKFSYIPTEFIMPTVAWNSSYRERVFSGAPGDHGNMRLIDWQRGGPYVFRSGDFEELSSSEMLFARKFDSRRDRAVVDRVCESLGQSSRAHEDP